MDQEQINKLPPDVKKEFMKYAIKYAEKKTQTKIQNDFMTFVKHVWPEFIEGRHHKKICIFFTSCVDGGPST